MFFTNRIFGRLFRYSNGRRNFAKLRSTKHRRTRIESLEPRLCLNGTAEIHGRWDVYGDAVDPYCSGIVIFLDADEDSLWDANED